MILELPDEIDLRAASDKRTYTTDAKGRHLYGVFEHIRERRPTAITGICLHQTACHMGERPARYLSTGAHMVVTREGQRFRLHDWTDRIVSANGFNARCISIEIDGLYAGDDSNDRRALASTWNDPSTKEREQPMKLTPAAIAAAREACRVAIREVPTIKLLLAHRQSSGTRQSDPGAAPWREIALPIIAEFGLNQPTPSYDPRTFKVDDGRPIPECWDPRCKGNAY